MLAQEIDKLNHRESIPINPTNPLMNIARIIRTLEELNNSSTCEEKQVSAVLIRDGRIILTATNGIPYGLGVCNKENHDSKKGCLHAEPALVTKAARLGISTYGSIMCVEYSPCFKCAEEIIAAGIKAVGYRKKHSDLSGLELLTKAGITIIKLEKSR